MCLISFAYKVDQKYPLILVANRDEFYDRPTMPAEILDDAPDILAGKDLKRGGTWLGVTRSGRFAAVTNYREPGEYVSRSSRGKLVSDFLKDSGSVSEFLSGLDRTKGLYAGFNLLTGVFNKDSVEFGYFSNRGDRSINIIEPGIYGLSNSLLDTPWPKVEHAKSVLSDLISDGFNESDLFDLLQNRSPAADKDLPETGIGIERERLLSPIFIETPVYGTRCSTVVTYGSESGLDLKEHVFR